MAVTFPISHITPIIFLYFLLFSPCSAINITHLLSSYPQLSSFTTLLTTTSVAADLTHRSSLTLLAVPNSLLRLPPPPSAAPDILRFHILLNFLSPSALRRLPPSGQLFPTLLHTTPLNITHNTNGVTIHSPNSTTTANVTSLIKTIPYNISIFTIDTLLIPYDLNLIASETKPPLGINITKTLIDGHNFNVAASMLTASGVEQEFEEDEGGAGITLFVPTDQAFSDLTSSLSFQSLSADKKADVLRFHVLHSYYPLGSLQSIVNPVQPTLATERNGAGSFTLNITSGNRSLSIDTGIVMATVTRTVFDQNPVAIFGVSSVLLPREFFGKNANEVDSNNNKPGLVGPPEIFLSPENSPGVGDPASSRLSSPPGLSSAAMWGTELTAFLGLWWIGYFCLLIIFN